MDLYWPPLSRIFILMKLMANTFVDYALSCIDICEVCQRNCQRLSATKMPTLRSIYTLAMVALSQSLFKMQKIFFCSSKGTSLERKSQQCKPTFTYLGNYGHFHSCRYGDQGKYALLNRSAVSTTKFAHVNESLFLLALATLGKATHRTIFICGISTG